MTETSCYESPVGTLLLAAEDRGLCGLWITGQKYFAATLPQVHTPNPRNTTLIAAVKWLDAYFSGAKPSISDLPLAPQGSEFRRQVWVRLCTIPYGQTVSYGELSREIAQLRGLTKMSAQAIGGAVGHNPISIIIPCHRVTGQDGSLTGYAGGLSRKLWLLSHEGADTTVFYIPKKGTAL